MLRRIKMFYNENKKSTFIVYITLRLLVIVCMVFQILHGNWDNVFLCVLTLFLFLIPYWLDKTLKITLPNALEIIILLFIFFILFLKHSSVIGRSSTFEAAILFPLQG